MRSIATVLGIVWLAALSGTAAAAGLQPLAIESYLVEPGRPAVLRWSVASDVADSPLDYVVRDYSGQTVAEGQAAVADGNVELRLTLPAGFHDIEFPATEQRFGILSTTVDRADPDPFFSIDSALSWLVQNDELRQGLVKMLHRSGIAMSRERLSWGQVQPAADRWDWESSRRYESLRKLYANEGVSMLEMFHDGPGWTGRVGKYPDDLVAAARSWRDITARWHGYWAALEIWNEPDISFGDNLPADQYAAVVKAVCYGAAADHKPLLVGGVVAHHNRAFLDNAARNGLLECVPVFSFHTYGRAEQMETLIGDYRQWLAVHDQAGVPLWITECGRPWKKGPPRPPADQDSTSALDITMKAVEAKACGIARYFAFVYPFYEERENNFGMMGREGTPLRSMAAYVAAARRLAHRPYIGDLEIDDPAVRRARVFGSTGKTGEVVLVLYTGEPKPEKTVALGMPVLRAEGIDGRELKATAEGGIPVPDGLTYVTLDRLPLATRLRPDTAAAKIRDAGRPAANVARPSLSPIVLRYQFDPALVSAVSEGYRITTDALDRFPLRVRAFNLAPQPQKVTLEVAFSSPEATLADSATRSVEVPGESSVDIDWTADLRRGFTADDRLTATIAVKGGADPAILPLVIDLMGEATMEQRLGRYSQTVRLPIENLAAWRPQIAGGGKIELGNPSPDGWRMTARFAPGDRWAYPRLPMPEGLDLSTLEAIVIRARCEKKAAVRVFLWEGDSGVGYITGGSIIPADGRWHSAVVRFGDLVPSTANAPDPNNRLDLDRVRSLSIGFNSDVDENTLEVSDAYLVGGKK